VWRPFSDRPASTPGSDPSGNGPASEHRIDGRVADAVDAVLALPLRGEKGRFVRAPLKDGQHSAELWNRLEPIKADIVARVRRQLAVDDDDGRETLLALIDGYAEAHLLRKSAFHQLTRRGGPVTNKGKPRGLLAAWGAFFDREMRAAEKLGLERRARTAKRSTRAWLLDDDDHDEQTADSVGGREGSA
jgi:hypothetical protein